MCGQKIEQMNFLSFNFSNTLSICKFKKNHRYCPDMSSLINECYDLSCNFLCWFRILLAFLKMQRMINCSFLVSSGNFISDN